MVRRLIVNAALFSALLAPIGGSAYAQTTQRPIADFVDAQGTTAGFLPPVPDFLGWVDGDVTVLASVDYAGLAAETLKSQGIDLNTRTYGNITERPLPDGRAMISVNLRTKNALTWLAPLFALPPGPGATTFGFTPQELAANPSLPPALGQSKLRLVFINTAPGAPLPDLFVALFVAAPPGFELLSMSFQSSSFGLTRDGRAAHLSVSQVAPRGPKGLAGTFTVENIRLQPAGSQ